MSVTLVSVFANVGTNEYGPIKRDPMAKHELEGLFVSKRTIS